MFRSASKRTARARACAAAMARVNPRAMVTARASSRARRKMSILRIAQAVQNADLEFSLYKSQKLDKVFMKIRGSRGTEKSRLNKEADRTDYQLRLDEKELKERIQGGTKVRKNGTPGSRGGARDVVVAHARLPAGPRQGRAGLHLEDLPAPRRLGVHGRGDAHGDLRHGGSVPLSVVRVHLRQVRLPNAFAGES